MRPLEILHKDERLLLCAKPPGLLTVPPPRGTPRRGEATLVDRLASQGHDVLPVHRLDRETSGVVLCARDAAAREALMQLFRQRDVRKLYLAFVQGRLSPGEGTIEAPIRDLGALAEINPAGRPARTRYRTLEIFERSSLLEVELLTGRHNQIRLHCAHVGHPLVGERKYARGRDALVRHKRAALHAARLSLTPPWSRELLDVEAPLPTDLENLLRRLRG